MPLPVAARDLKRGILMGVTGEDSDAEGISNVNICSPGLTSNCDHASS
jgi:hypothetical protein